MYFVSKPPANNTLNTNITSTNVRSNRNYWWLQNQFRVSVVSFTIVIILLDWLIAIAAPNRNNYSQPMDGARASIFQTITITYTFVSWPRICFDENIIGVFLGKGFTYGSRLYRYTYPDMDQDVEHILAGRTICLFARM